MSNEIVKYHNDMNKVSLNGFNKLELDLYAAIVSRMRNEELELISFKFDYLKELIKWKDTDNTKFVKTLRSMYRKLLNCTFAIENKKMIIEFVLFTRYRIDLENKKIDIIVNGEFAWILNNLKLSFTRFELEEYVEIKSTYVKKFYMQMKQFRTTGKWIVSLEEFRRLLDIPEKYRISHIDKKVLEPITEELKEKYGVYVLKKYDNKKRGRPSVSGFEFTFIKDIIDNTKKKIFFKVKDNRKELNPVSPVTSIEILPQSYSKKYTSNEFIGAFKDFLDMRKQIRKPALTAAIEIIIKQLEEVDNEQTAIKMLQVSIAGSYPNIYELKGEYNGKNSKGTSDDEYKWEHEESSFERRQREKREREGYQEPEIEDDPNDDFPF